MIIKRKLFSKGDNIISTKRFSWFDNIFNKKKLDNNKKQITVDQITFKELEDNNNYWPALVTLGIKDEDDGTPDHGWGKFDDWFRSNGFYEGGKGRLVAVHVLSDNVNGSNGASANVLEFSPETKISTYKRLAYGSNFKWPEDFIYNYSSWYKSSRN